ncbi:MAG TPA: riboflavin kinase, partial [Saprospiraceae bacterium]|nr:riboflavin kinase [Saprospiraceae bacterium]
PFSPDFARLSARQYVEDFLIRLFRPRYVVIGYDHRFGHDREGNLSFLKKYETSAGFEVVEIAAQLVDDLAVSSSKIRKALEMSDVHQANRLLGHPFTLSGQVVEGQRIGRTIGFPTANLHIADPYKLRPPEGIYAARAFTPSPSANAHPAMLYIGRRPTLDGQHAPVIEVHLLGFSGDLYGQTLRVEVLDFIRSDKKLDSLEALWLQIEADRSTIQQRLAQWGHALHAAEPEETAAPAAASVAIVILNYNTRRHLQEYLPSVVAHSAGAKIVVADNGSPDDSIAFVQRQYPQVEVIDLHRNYGFAQGYNEALQRFRSLGGRCEYYVLLNSDVEVTANWLEPVLQAMREDRTVGVAQPKILSWRHKSRFEYAGACGGWIDGLGYPFCRGRLFQHVEEDRGQYDSPAPCFWASGAAFFIRAELYHRFGGFDGDYFAHNEEIDLCWRVQRAGYSVWCIPQSVVYHLGGGTLDYESPRKVYLNFRNSLVTLLKNEGLGKLLWLVPARLVLDGVAAARFAVKGQGKAVWAILRGHFSLYRQWAEVMRKRREAGLTVERERIGPSRLMEGMYRGSVVAAHYLRRIKNFSDLF